MVAQQFLVLFVVVRIRLGQHKALLFKKSEAFCFYVAKEKLWWFESAWDNIKPCS